MTPGDAAPRITVAICTYNSSSYLEEAIESVLLQTCPAFDLLLVDDGSTNGCIERIQDRFQDDRIRILRLRHQGLGAARAASVEHARGEFVAFLDHDDTWQPAKLAVQAAVAVEHPDAALIFSDSHLVDAAGRRFGKLSDRFDFSAIDLTTPGQAVRELLTRGCFIDVSTVLARRSILARAGNFDPRYVFVEDFDMWLRIARQHRIICVPEALASRRMHPDQFTERQPAVRLAEQTALLGPLVCSASYPREIRKAVAHYLLGQHRDCTRSLLGQGHVATAARTVAGMCRYPRALAEYVLTRLYGSVIPAPARRRIRTLRRQRASTAVASASRATDVWIDGTPLGAMPAGSFNSIAELIRSVARWERGTVHATLDPAGASALGERLGPDARRVQVHTLGAVRDRRAIRSRIARVLQTAARRPGGRGVVEVITWRGHFRFRRSRKIALVADLTTRVHPELHTRANVDEFDDYLRYATRHAHAIATVSEHSRRDILSRLHVFPASVHRIPVNLHPAYRDPSFDPRVPRAHGISGPYLLAVGTIEPRKNLRRLVEAFEHVRQRLDAGDWTLVLAGPRGWDDDFLRDLARTPSFDAVRYIGYVPPQHMPSLYHFASAVIYPSVYEGFGLPVLEAMCCSSLVLASRISSIPEILADGIRFDPYCVEAMADAIDGALRLTPVEAAAYRRQCRAQADALLARCATEPPLPGL